MTLPQRKQAQMGPLNPLHTGLTEAPVCVGVDGNWFYFKSVA